MPASAALDADKSSAVIFVYQRVGDDSLPDSSISMEQFKEHLKELKTGGYNVLPLAHIVGFAATDAGKAVDGILFRGLAPDIGVAEQ